MLVVGLTGGMGVGKSTVAAMFAARGAAVVDADAITRRLQERDQPCYRAVVKAFGREILDGSGHIDRRRLAGVVFADPCRLRQLEAIMHPAIWEACDVEVQAAAAAGRSMCLIEMAVLFESGGLNRFDAIVVVKAPATAQVERTVRTRGLTEAEARQRLSAQWSEAAKAERADYLIDNGGDLAATEAQVVRVYNELARRAGLESKNA